MAAFSAADAAGMDFLMPLVILAVIAIVFIVSFVKIGKKSRSSSQTQGDAYHQGNTYQSEHSIYQNRPAGGINPQQKSRSVMQTSRTNGYTMDQQYTMQQNYSQKPGQKTIKKVYSQTIYQKPDSLVRDSAFDSARNHPKWYNSTSNWGNTNTNYSNQTNEWGAFTVKGAGEGWNRKNGRAGKGWKRKKHDDNPFLV